MPSAVSCTGTNRKGEPCKAPVVRGSDPPQCRRHLIGLEAFQEQAKRGGHRRWEVARETDIREHIESHVLKQRLEERLAGMLDAKLPGSNEPDHEAVGYALLAIAENFKWGPEELAEWVRRERPQLAREPRAHAFLDVEAARKRLLDAYSEGRISRGDVPVGVLD